MHTLTFSTTTNAVLPILSPIKLNHMYIIIPKAVSPIHSSTLKGRGFSTDPWVKPRFTVMSFLVNMFIVTLVTRLNKQSQFILLCPFTCSINRITAFIQNLHLVPCSNLYIPTSCSSQIRHCVPHKSYVPHRYLYCVPHKR